MLRFFKKLFTPAVSSLPPSKPIEIAPIMQGASKIPVPGKDQLFAWWAQDNFGDEEGTLLFRGLFEADRIAKSVYTHGDFVTARQSLIRIAMLFPDAARMPIAPAEGMPDTPSQIQWRELMTVQYAKPAL